MTYLCFAGMTWEPNGGAVDLQAGSDNLKEIRDFIMNPPDGRLKDFHWVEVIEVKPDGDWEWVIDRIDIDEYREAELTRRQKQRIFRGLASRYPQKVDYAMFTPEGNEAVEQAVTNIVHYARMWPKEVKGRTQAVVSAVALKHPEVYDTAVREAMYNEIEKRLDRIIWK